MTQRTRDLFLIYGLAVLVNGVVALLVSRPGYTDAYYYFNGARFIVEGHWSEPYLWNYVGAPPSLPAPAFAYWQPLPSLLAAAGILTFGRAAAFGSAQAIYSLVAGVLPVVTYLVASQIGKRRHALLAGLLTVFSGFYVIYWSLPESFTPFALSGAGALALTGLAIQARRWWVWALAGVCAGLAHLTRADGVLLMGVVVLAGIFALPSTPILASRDGQSGAQQAVPPRSRLLRVGAALLGYLVIMAPWFARNLATFGSFQAPGGLGALWLNDYNDLFNYPSNVTAERFFSAGWAAILSVKAKALLGNLATFVGVQNLVFLTPLTLIGLWRRWRSPWLLPAMVYGLALFVVMTFAFSLVGVRGGYFHSGGALLPFMFTAAILGLDDVLGWMARRCKWNFESASRVFGAGSVVVAACVTVYLIGLRVIGLPFKGSVAWNSSDAVYGEIGAALDELTPHGLPVMSNDPPGFYYYTGRGGIPLPNGDEETLLRAAHDYTISYLVVDRNVPVGLESLYLDGPASSELVLIKTFGSAADPIYLYRVRSR